MIVHDHRSTSIAAASVVTLGMFFLSPSLARASDDALGAPVAPVTAASEAPASTPATTNVDIRLTCDGRYTIVSTKSQTVGEFLAARDIRVAQNDFVSAPLDSALVNGMNLSYRSVKTITILDGKRRLVVRSSAPTIGSVVKEAGFHLGANDLVTPAGTEEPLPSDVIRIAHGTVSITHTRVKIAQAQRYHSSADMMAGTARTIDPGRPGLRETTKRVFRDGEGRVLRTTLASRIIRTPRAAVIERGVAQYSTLAAAAEHGFTSAFRFAGSAIHMIATAYTSSCYGCSGITASGQRAGFGVIAVDPSVIPLGTKLFIPGYGRAIAGDTGGAIVGHRVDLGMNTVAEAMRFGRRPITVYVLR